MFDAVFANLATNFAAQFGAPYADAVATWPGMPTKDAGGSITSPGAPVSKTCKVQIDAATQSMRAAEGFLETDVRLLVLSATLAGQLDTAARVTTGGRTYAVLSCVGDPAGIGWECRGRAL